MSSPRPIQHEIDTVARRLVPRCIPKEWEHRESTGRDYGIDMMIEMFETSRATGKVLFLQIKGTNADFKVADNKIIFDASVKNLKYSLLFSAPILLVICNTQKDEECFYYLWLQEYIRVVLDHEHAAWRNNKKSVRLYIPIENKMPGNEGLLKFMAGYPKRSENWGQVGRLQHELNHAVFFTNDTSLLGRKDFEKAESIFEDALSLSGIFGDDSYHWGKSIRQTLLEPALKATQLAIKGPPYKEEDIAKIGQKFTSDEPPEFSRDQIMDFIIRSTIMQSAQRLSACLSIGNDFRLKYKNWIEVGGHDF